MALTAAEHRAVQAQTKNRRNAAASDPDRAQILRRGQPPDAATLSFGMVEPAEKRRNPHDLCAVFETLATVPLGRARVALALLVQAGTGPAATYPEVAAALRVHVGTVHEHLRRLRIHEPAVYRLVMEHRRQQLQERHVQALARAAAHSDEWHRSQARQRYYYRFGMWPYQWRNLPETSRKRLRAAWKQRQHG